MKPIRYLVLREGALSLMRAGTLFMLDTIAPPDPEERRIGRMTVDEFSYEAGTATEPGPEGTLSFFPYRALVVKTALVGLKNTGSRELSRLLGTSLVEKLDAEVPAAKAGHIVIPIPITAKKKRERGFNQCELIVEHLSLAGYAVRNDLLYKTRETADQVGKRRGERFENLRQSFAVRENESAAHFVRGRDFIVFDDIVTTGATLYEARRALLDAGAASVLCVAIAR